MDNRPIGIFDSGLGGLTVARALHKRLPHESIIYFGDAARCPYGPRSLDEVRGYVGQICALLAAHDVKLIVIACNTATVAGLAWAQRTFDVPVMGVLDSGAHGAVRTTRNRRIGVIATQATVASGMYEDTIRSLDAGVRVRSVAAPRLVQIVEEGMRRIEDLASLSSDDVERLLDQPRLRKVVHEYVAAFGDYDMDTLVLGCTHYPVLASLIQKETGNQVCLVSSSEELAHEVVETLAARGHLRDTALPSSSICYTTDDDVEGFGEIASHILGMSSVEDVRHVSVGALESQALHLQRARDSEEES